MNTRPRTKYENIKLDLKFIEITQQDELVFPIFKVPEGYTFMLKSIRISSTIYYDRYIGEVYFRLADYGKRMIPNVIIAPNVNSVHFDPPLQFQKEISLIINPKIKSFADYSKQDISAIPLASSNYDRTPATGYPFMINVRIEGVLYAE